MKIYLNANDKHEQKEYDLSLNKNIEIALYILSTIA